LFQWCLLLAIVGVLAVGGFLYFRLDDEIRRQVERRLAEHYRGLDVHVESARFDADRGIAISRLKLTQKTPDGKSQTVLDVEEMYLAGNVRMEQLVTGQLPIDEIVVRGPKLRAAHLPDGSWSTHALLPMPHFGPRQARIKIENATTTIEDAANPAAKPLTITGINLDVVPVPSGAGDSSVGRFHVSGTTTSLPAKEIRLEADFGAVNNQFDLLLTVIGLEISPETFSSIPGFTMARLRGADFSGRADVTLKLNRTSADAPMVWATTFKVDRGQLNHPMLPETLADVSFAGRADSNQLFIDRLYGRCGSATVVAAFNRAGWSDSAAFGLSAKILGWMVDERTRAGLPESYARIWDRFKPTGLVDAEVGLTFDGQKWRPILSANCRGISLTDTKKFPYTLEQTTGHVEYRAAEDGKTDELRLDLTGIGGGRPVRVAAQLTHVARVEEEGGTTATGVASTADRTKSISSHAAGYRGVGYSRHQPSDSHPLGFVSIAGTDVPIHEQLLAALPTRAQALTRSLQPQGAIDFDFRAEWKDSSQANADVTQKIELKDCRIQFTRFPYPLQHVHGFATSKNDRWKLEGFEGRGVTDATIVKCRGEANPNSAGYDVDLIINAFDVPLDDTLKISITSAAGQRAWEELRPQGRVNFVAHATKQADQTEPAIEVNLSPCGKTVSIEPRMFYRLEQIQGQAMYQRGRVDLSKIVAQHDRTIYSAESGIWQAAADGGWQLGLKNLTADRLEFSRDFRIALPPALQSSIEKLQPTGTFLLYKSNLTVAKSRQLQGIAAGWDLNLECQQAAIQGAMPMRGINGGIHLVGRSDGRSAYTAGEMAIDSASLKDAQLTNVRGPIWIDNSRILLGESACQIQNQPPRRLTADAYGGSLNANLNLLRGDNPSYNLDVHIGGMNLARFANERLGGPNDLNGTVSGALVVSGSGHSTETLRGGGQINVVDANIYQLPPLVAMLKLLSNRPPNATAFNRCDMQFDIQGEHIHFKQLNLLGDAVSLYGNGEADLSHKLDLVFYTLIGPAEFAIPFVKTIVGHVSQQGLQIKVVGTFEHPETERKAFPAIDNMLDHIQNGIQEGAATMSPNTAARGARVPGR
jgi:hypothetical protein